MCVIRDSATEGGRRSARAHPPTTSPTCVGEESAEEAHAGLRMSSIQTGTSVCVLRDSATEGGDGAHAPAAPPTCVGEASTKGFEKKRYSNGHERCECYATA